MMRNCRQRLFQSAQSGFLLLSVLSPLTALSVPVESKNTIESKPTQENVEVLPQPQPAATDVPPIPAVDKNTIAMSTPAQNIPNQPSAETQTQAMTQESPDMNANQTTADGTAAVETQPVSSVEAPVETTSQAVEQPPVAKQEQPNKQGEVLVPNGAAIQSQLMPIGQGSETPWASYATVGFLILGMAATGLLLIKIRQGKSFGPNKSERQMQIISNLSLSPKRQILLVKIRDKEVALASTETGITLLTEIDTPFRSAPHLIDDSGNEEPRRRKVQQKLAKEEPSRMIAAASEDSVDESAMARSEMLMGALKNLREKSLRGKHTAGVESTKTTANEPKIETVKKEELQDPAAYLKNSNRSEPTMRQTRAAFPKYLANAFEKEANRPSAQQQGDEAGNVTNMIRERLKELRPLS